MQSNRALFLLFAGTALVVTAAAASPERVDIRTIPVAPDIAVQSATYTPSGKILVAYQTSGVSDPRDIKLATMNDGGTAMRTFFSQRVPDRPKDNGLRYMMFPDNRRIFTGDFVIECREVLEKCDKPALIPVQFPAAVADGKHIAHRWSEIIVAPDNKHIAWTSLLANFSAVVMTGELRKSGGVYVIAKPQIISTLDPFKPDPDHADGGVPQVIRGGEVKQFVRGGTAISLAGAVKRDLANSTLLDLTNGAVEAVTDTPGYTETTIFSPDERLGITMTTRFSAETDLAILGLLPRPYPASLNVGLNMFAYTYGVTGVRAGRPGNVGPALIDIKASQTQAGYQGINLNTDPLWVYYSPMSWHPGSTKAIWMEGLRGAATRRIQIVTLPDYKASKPVAAKPTPDAMSYASSDLSVIPALVGRSQNIDVKVYGRASGHIAYRRTATSIEKRYLNFSDDGRSFLSGSEITVPNPRGTSTYTADLTLSGETTGVMNLTVTFGPLGGKSPARLIFDPDASGMPQSRGYAEYQGKRMNVSNLKP